MGTSPAQSPGSRMNASNPSAAEEKTVSDTKGVVYESAATGKRLLVPYEASTGALLDCWCKFNLGQGTHWKADLAFVGASSVTDWDLDLGNEVNLY